MNRLAMILTACALISPVLLLGCFRSTKVTPPRRAPEPVVQPVANACGFVANGRLKILGLSVASVTPDPEGTMVQLRFEVVDAAGAPVNDLAAGRNGDFRFCDDGREDFSGEAASFANLEENPIDVALVLDTSVSMEQDGALGVLKRSASEFVRSLGSRQFDFHVYQFATAVERLESVDDIDPVTASGRWTSLYAAIAQAVRENPGATVVVFTDGADNYSQQASHGPFRIEGVARLETLVRSTGTPIHVIGLGNFDTYRDSSRVSSTDAMRRLAQFGSFGTTARLDDLPAVFRGVADRIAKTYYVDYLSQHTQGRRELGILAAQGGRSGLASIVVDLDRAGVRAAEVPASPQAAPAEPRTSALSKVTITNDTPGTINLSLQRTPGAQWEQVSIPPDTSRWFTQAVSGAGSSWSPVINFDTDATAAVDVRRYTLRGERVAQEHASSELHPGGTYRIEQVDSRFVLY